ncbi:MAG TPA: DUF1573 domain-containing protein [Candidatus Paceibacterota bacterium]|nr:DUF1573 domain-containing protein [Candidatus Paceibacterota bacterium]
MKTILFVLIGTLAAAGILAWAARPGGTPLATPMSDIAAPGPLEPSETSFDFGTISMAAGTVRHRIAVTNTGASSVTLGKTYTSCMCTSVSLDHAGRKYGPYGMLGHGFIPRVNASVAPQDTASLIITFDPAAHGPSGVGPIQRTVTMENDAGTPVVVSFTANVTP